MKRKTTTLTIAAAALAACAATAQDTPAPITLNAPDLNRPASMMQAFSKRASATDYGDRALELQDLSDLLWAANGVNRAAEKKRTAPSTSNMQEVFIYVFSAEGAYLYDAFGSVLKPVAKGDFRAQVVTQQPPEGKPHPPMLVFLVCDISLLKNIQDEAGKIKAAAIDAGIVSQNIGLFCAGAGLATRPRVSNNAAKLKEILHLTDTQIPMLHHPVGYMK